MNKPIIPQQKPKDIKSIRGISLIEILIALAISSVIFLVIARTLASGSQGLAVLVSAGELMEDTRNAGEMIHDSLLTSVYVYPPLTELELNASVTFDTKNPNTETNTWTIGQDPIVAMIVAPVNNSLDCPSNPDACLNFVAYYAVKRSEATGEGGLSFIGDAVDTHNPDAWMIFEYRKILNAKQLSEVVAPPIDPSSRTVAGSLSNVTARLVADYIDPIDGFVLTSEFCNIVNILNTSLDVAQPCPVVGEAALPVRFRNTLLTGSFQIKASFKKGSRENNTPSLNFEFSPRNLY